MTQLTAVKQTLRVGSVPAGITWKPVEELEIKHDQFANRFVGELYINGVRFIVEAIEVDPLNPLRALGRKLQEELSAYQSLAGYSPEGAVPEVIDIDGRPHVLFIYPQARKTSS